MAAGSNVADGTVSIDVDIEDGRTTITVAGEREVAVVVRSDSGERIYLPPEEQSEPAETTPYRGGTDTPYDGAPAATPYDGPPTESPYESTREPPSRVGRTETQHGFRIVHDEPVRDVRILR